MNPIPARDVRGAVVDTGTAAGDFARREHLVAEVEGMVVVRFAVTGELQPEDAITERSLICES